MGVAPGSHRHPDVSRELAGHAVLRIGAPAVHHLDRVDVVQDFARRHGADRVVGGPPLRRVPERVGQDHDTVAARADDAGKLRRARGCPQCAGVGGGNTAGQQHHQVVTPEAHLQARD